jgi:Flp pilus assembly protein TadD
MYQAAKFLLSISIVTLSFLFILAPNTAAQSNDLKQTLAESLNRQAIVKLTAEDYNGAIELLNRAIATAPSFAAVHMNLGSAYMLSGKPEEAIPHLKRGLELEPKSHEGFNQLGVAYDKLKKRDLSIEALKKAVEIKPDYARGYFNLGAAYMWSGKEKQAQEAFEKAAQLNPEQDEIQLYLAVIYARKGKYREAIAQTQKVTQRTPGNEEAQLILCKIYLLADDRQAALNIYQSFKAVNAPLAERMFKSIFSDKVLFVPSDMQR